MRIPLVCYDMNRINGLIASTAFWEATARNTRKVKVYDHDKGGKTLLGHLGFHWYETRTNDRGVKADQNRLTNLFHEGWWLALQNGPAEVAIYIEGLIEDRKMAIKRCESIRHQVMQVNGSITQSTERIITGLQITRAASVLIVGGVATFGAVAAAAGALGATTTAATAAAQGVGGVSLAQGLSIAVIDSWHQARSAEAVAIGVGKELGKEAATKSLATIHDHINPGQQDVMRMKSLKKAEQFNRRLSEQVKAKKIRKWGRKVEAQKAAASKAGAKAALGRAAAVGGGVLSFVFFKQSAQEEIAKVFETLN